MFVVFRFFGFLFVCFPIFVFRFSVFFVFGFPSFFVLYFSINSLFIRELFIFPTFRFQFYNFRFFIFVLWYFNFCVLFFTFSFFCFPRFWVNFFHIQFMCDFSALNEWISLETKARVPKKSLEIQGGIAFQGAFWSFSDGFPVSLFFSRPHPPSPPQFQSRDHGTPAPVSETLPYLWTPVPKL